MKKMRLNNKRVSNIRSKNNRIEISIPYHYVVYVAILFASVVAGGFAYFSHKMRVAQEKIDSLQLGLHSIQKSLLETNKTNESLGELITKLNIRNEELTSLVSKLSTENESLLIQINTLKNLPIHSTPYLSDPLVKLILGAAILSVTVVGGYYLVSFVATKFADSSIGWFLSGVDSHLKNIGNKLGVFSTNTSTSTTSTFKDSVGREYVVYISDKTPNLSSIQVKSQGELVDIGNYISELLNTITSLQNSTTPVVKTSGSGVQAITETAMTQAAQTATTQAAQTAMTQAAQTATTQAAQTATTQAAQTAMTQAAQTVNKAMGANIETTKAVVDALSNLQL